MLVLYLKSQYTLHWLWLAALNDLEVKTADIKNAYLTAPVSEKIWCVLGPEFGANAGKRAIVVWSLYGLKSAGASFWNHLADCMQHLGWESCIADQDLWMKEYYGYALLYVDDIWLHCTSWCRAMPTTGWQVFYDEARLNWWPRFLSRSQVENKKAIKWGISLEHQFQQVYSNGWIQNVKDYVNMTHPGQGLPKHASGPSGCVPKHLTSMIRMCHSTNCKLVYCIGVLS